MSSQYSTKACKHCKGEVRAERFIPNHILHLLLTVFTAGLWIPIWIILAIKVDDWRCCKCSGKVS